MGYFELIHVVDNSLATVCQVVQQQGHRYFEIFWIDLASNKNQYARTNLTPVTLLCPSHDSLAVV